MEMVAELKQQPMQVACLLPEKFTLISCHNFVLSTLHHACTNCDEPIPDGLTIPPRFAWSDILYKVAIEDETIETTFITQLSGFISRGSSPSVPPDSTNCVSFFPPEKIPPKPLKQGCKLRCVIL